MKYFVLLLSIILLATSCIKDVDKNQVYDSSFRIPIHLALINIDLDDADFTTTSSGDIENLNKKYITGLKGIFNDSKSDTLDYSIGISTSFERDTKCIFQYTDSIDVIIPSLTHGVSFSSKTNTYSETRTYIGDDFRDFMRAKWVYVTIETGASAYLIDPPLDGDFSLKTTLDFIFDYQPQEPQPPSN